MGTELTGMDATNFISLRQRRLTPRVEKWNAQRSLRGMGMHSLTSRGQHRRVGSPPMNQLGIRANAGSGGPALALLLSSCAT